MTPTLWSKPFRLRLWIEFNHFWCRLRRRQYYSWISIVIWPKRKFAVIWADHGTLIRIVSVFVRFVKCKINSASFHTALAITHAFPCRNSKHDRLEAGDVELEIQRTMLKHNLMLVGWYHSHPKCAAQPTLRDCDAQLEYQIKMRGASEATYSPCVGLICGKFDFSKKNYIYFAPVSW